MNIAYLSQGKLYLKRGQEPVREIESPFGEWTRQRRLQIQSKNAWKNQGLRSMLNPQIPMITTDPLEKAVIPVSITSLCRNQPDEILYTLECGEMGGLFRFNLQDTKEDRLFHTTDFRIGHLDYSPTHHLIACSKSYSTGISNLATLPLESVRSTDVTEGDSIDQAPRWIPSSGKALVYQSAGVHRNSQGFMIGRAPFTIEKLDFEKGEVTTLASDPNYDLLGPCYTETGWLYYIRCPYQPIRVRLSWRQFFKDLILLPFRLFYAIFQFFNMFTTLFTGRPLITAVTQQAVTQQKVETTRLRTLRGWLTYENLAKKQMSEQDTPALVPPTWELVRQGSQGVPEVVAISVLAYDISPEGKISYTNGSSIFVINSEGNFEKILTGKCIEQILVLSEV